MVKEKIIGRGQSLERGFMSGLAAKDSRLGTQAKAFYHISIN